MPTDLTERREGEAWLTVPESVAACKWTGSYGVEWHTEAVAQRAAVARLTAEVERLRGMVKEAYEEGRVSHDYKWEDSNTFYDLEHPAALSLPTPAPLEGRSND